MSYFAPPVELHGNTDQQISDIYTYLFKLANQLNLRFEETTPAAIFAEVNKALEHADSGKETNQAIADNYQQLKALVIKTADYTAGYGDVNTEQFSGYFVAKSEFGEYKEQTNAVITQTSTDLTQMYEYAASLGILGNGESDVDITEIETWSQAYIKSGLLYYDGASAKYGVAVGNVNELVTIDGHEVINRQNLLSTFTADEFAFWQSGNKVAYIQSGAMYFPSAHISGGSIEIGGSESGSQHVQGKFYVDNEGNLTASSATITGQLTAQSGSKLGNWDISTAIYNGKTSLSDSSHGGIYIGTDGVYLGNGASTETSVKLLSDGTLTANSANITGTLNAGSGSTIADWTVGKTTGTNPISYIYSGSRTSYSSTASGIYIGTDGISMGSPTSTASGSVGVQISSSGALTCRGATINGAITAESGSIGGWTIGTSAIYTNGKTTYNSSTQGLCLSTSGIGIRGSTNYCTISSTGQLTCTGASVSGAITASSLTISSGATISGLTVTESMISGTISASKIGAGTLTSTNSSNLILLKGYLTVTDSSGNVKGLLGYGSGISSDGMGIGGVGAGGGTVIATSSGAKMYVGNSQVYVNSSGVLLSNSAGQDIYFLGTSMYPDPSSTISLGSDSKRWDNIWGRTGNLVGSDRNEKTDISYDNDEYLEVFDKLQPATYKRIDGTSNRTHFGFIAQDVEDAIIDSGMTTQQYAVVAKYELEDGEGYGYALRYDEIIPLAVLKIKKLEQRIAALEGA